MLNPIPLCAALVLGFGWGGFAIAAAVQHFKHSHPRHDLNNSTPSSSNTSNIPKCGGILSLTATQLNHLLK